MQSKCLSSLDHHFNSLAKKTDNNVFSLDAFSYDTPNNQPVNKVLDTESYMQ